MIIQGDALEVLKTLPSGSVNCMVTSPPYYGLRDYGVIGQIGLESSVEEYISKLIAVFNEAWRVLRNDGTLWVNIGDSFAGSGKGGAKYPENAGNYKQGTNRGLLGQATISEVKARKYKAKNLMLVPFRFAIEMQNAGWNARQDIIWSKPNTMPESVKDRCTKSHEYIFLFSKSRKYYFDYKAIQEPCVGFNNEPVAGSNGAFGQEQKRRRKGNSKRFRGGGAYTNNGSFDNSSNAQRQTNGNVPNETGLRNKRDVWTVAIKGCKEAHFATFPPELIKPCILAGCPAGGVVLDMFFGSGTVGEVAARLGRDFIGIELNAEYIKLSEKRINNGTRIENSAAWRQIKSKQQ